MNGNMWVESELGVGSKFFFTITAKISRMTTEAVQAKMQPFGKRSILFYNTVKDRSGTTITQQLQDLELNPTVIDTPAPIRNKFTCPHYDAILVDKLTAVSGPICHLEIIRY